MIISACGRRIVPQSHTQNPMPLFTIGISHHTAPIEIREKVAITRSEYADRVQELCAMSGVEEVVILGTCNRTEIYCLSSKTGKEAMLDWIHRINDISPGFTDEHTELSSIPK